MTQKGGIDSVTNIWKRKSISFKLPYWRKLLLSHNLDILHIEKNACDNLIGIMLGIVGKINDNLYVRFDLKAMGIRTSHHPVLFFGQTSSSWWRRGNYASTFILYLIKRANNYPVWILKEVETSKWFQL